MPDSFLIDGVNTIAVEVHQVSGSSSDLGFDLEIQGKSGFTVEGQLFMDMDGNGDLSSFDIFGSGAVEIKFYNDADSNGILISSEEIGSVLTHTDGTFTATIANDGTVTGVSEGGTTFIFTPDDTGCQSEPTDSVFVSPSPTVFIDGSTEICVCLLYTSPSPRDA